MTVVLRLLLPLVLATPAWAQFTSEQADELKGFADRAIAESIAKGQWENPFWKNMNLKAELGYTDNNSSTGGPGIEIPSRFGDDETVWKLGLGRYEKPLRDIAKAAGGKGLFKPLTDGWTNRPIAEKAILFFPASIAFVFDNTKASAYVQYGNTHTDPEGSQNFSTKRKFTYFVGGKFKMDFRKSLRP